jgi:two-component system response regulator AtoC
MRFRDLWPYALTGTTWSPSKNHAGQEFFLALFATLSPQAHTDQTEIEQIGEELCFVAASPASRRMRTQAELYSQTDVPLLITGELGSGKATAARLIHSLSIRSSFPFVRVNCAALTSDLLESELFGHEHLAVNGGIKSRPGKFEQCAKGTVLLQDFEALPSSVQLQLLKLLQTRECVHFEQSPIRADVRIMATTRCNLEQAVANGKVHEDLYYRLSVFELDVPPLRERREEIPLLLGHFVNRLTRRYGVPEPSYSGALLEACQNYLWPGNLRQLEIFVKRFLVFGDEAAALEDLKLQPFEAAGESGNGDSTGFGKNGTHLADEKSPLKLLVRHAKGETERNAIARALEETHWNRKAAARLLSISYRALLYKIQEYQLMPRETLPFRARNGIGNRGY